MRSCMVNQAAGATASHKAEDILLLFYWSLRVVVHTTQWPPKHLLHRGRSQTLKAVSLSYETNQRNGGFRIKAMITQHGGCSISLYDTVQFMPRLRCIAFGVVPLEKSATMLMHLLLAFTR